MTGIIVAGHGNFATGLTSGLKLLAGEPEYYEVVDFEPEDSIEILTEKLSRALERLKDCESVAIFTDLNGGSPYNVAVRMKLQNPDRCLEVTGGTNLPAILQAYMSRSIAKSAAALMDGALEAGKGQMIRLTKENVGEEEDCEEIEE